MSAIGFKSVLLWIYCSSLLVKVFCRFIVLVHFYNRNLNFVLPIKSSCRGKPTTVSRRLSADFLAVDNQEIRFSQTKNCGIFFIDHKVYKKFSNRTISGKTTVFYYSSKNKKIRASLYANLDRTIKLLSDLYLQACGSTCA